MDLHKAIEFGYQQRSEEKNLCADSLALRNVGHVEIEGIPYDDFYYDGASLMANQSHQGVFRNSDESLVRHSTPFQSLSLEGFPASEATKADFRMGL
ncbi:uncharacterized protein LOC122005315 isoform X3 [Zingiber officinale]|uniref:uncharacterized protein LOC122005315 isoform X3 n=1 Tax=Zingiber officinale TaxID=94328 RepID=UPI001C4DACF7|nr:uncharacterized protein LOC122005315 isoform X3 [Zingiber officinale]